MAIGMWLMCMACIVAYLMVSHLAVLPHPKTNDTAWESRLHEAVPPAPESWTALHILYDNCACSRRVLKHVIASSPIKNVQERVVLVSDSPHEPSPARDALDVEYVTPGELQAKFGVESAPLLVVLDDNQRVRYTGGYTSRKQGPEIMDREIITRLISGNDVTELPLFGCAVSSELKRLVDPLGLKSN